MNMNVVSYYFTTLFWNFWDKSKANYIKSKMGSLDCPK